MASHQGRAIVEPDALDSCHSQPRPRHRCALSGVGGLQPRRAADPVGELLDGIAAIVPGKPDASELMVRIVSTDKDELMPPPKSHKPRLDAEQVEVLRRWIAEGAAWGKHWAFERPGRDGVPCMD